MNERSCVNCIKGRNIPVLKDILCCIHGVVSPDYVCRSHRFISTPRRPRELEFKCTDCDNFRISISILEDDSITGTCQLFSTRAYKGNVRYACSKFVMREIREYEAG